MAPEDGALAMANTFRFTAALIIVLMISTGQILFKVAAERLRAADGQLALPVLSVLTLSLLLYGIATLGWIWVLQSYPLSRIYPLMALSFIFVPIGGTILFGERLSSSFFAGTGLLLIGLSLIMLPRD
jgi:drug/metabolite transporter (DMT)-like permease